MLFQSESSAINNLIEFSITVPSIFDNIVLKKMTLTANEDQSATIVEEKGAAAVTTVPVEATAVPTMAPTAGGGEAMANTLMPNRNNNNNSSNATFLPFFQQAQSLSLGGGIPGLPPQVLNQQMPHQVLRMPQGFENSFYLQQLLAMQAGNRAQVNPLGLPMNNARQGAPSRPSPSAQDVQNALATIAAATGMPAGANPMNTPALANGASNQVLPFQPTGAGDGKSPHPPIIVYMECDEESLSDYQCLLRKQIEMFEATADDVQWNAQGRNKAIVLGQVGIRCRYCARLATWARARGAVYYSGTLDGLYQAAQNMAKNHLCKHCRLIPPDVKNELLGLRDFKRRAAGGKNYWGEGARVLGVYESKEGLRFKNSTTGLTNTEPASEPASENVPKPASEPAPAPENKGKEE